MTSLEQNYTISHDWKGKRYLGIDLDWDYNERKVHLSMMKYVKEALIRFNHAVPFRPQYQPHPHIKLKYGQKMQYTEEEDTSPPLTAANKKLVQEVLGVFLYYGRAIDITMITALGTLATQKSAPTETTLRNFHNF